MRKFCLAALAVTLLMGVDAVRGADVANSKPVLTVSFAGYDQFYANLSSLSKLGGPNSRR